MADITHFLKSLLSTAGLTGHESPAADIIEARWKPIADESHRSRLGSVHALSAGDGYPPRPKLLISAHMDAIGLMVADVADGFLTLSPVGNVDPRVLPSQSVIVHGRETLHGIIVPLPAAFRANPKEAITFDDLRVDVGLPPKRLAQLVQAGDLVSFATEPLELRGGILSGHSLDNRASIAALTLAMEELQLVRHDWDVWFAATVQEELTYAGGGTSAFALRPDLAIIVDVTFGEDGNGKNYETFPLGGGLTLGVGPSIHPFLLKKLKELANKFEIPFAIEPMPEESFTETDLIQLTRAGIPTAIISIPLRYMHTPIEVVALADIERTAKLLTEFSAMLKRDFLQTVTWDDCDGLALVRARLDSGTNIWFARFVLIITAILTFSFALELSADGVLFIFWRRTILVFAIAAVAIAILIIAWRLTDSALTRITHLLSPITHLASRIGIFGFLLSAALMLFLFLGPWRDSFQSLAARFLILWFTSLIAASFLIPNSYPLSPNSSSNRLPLFLLTLLLFTSLYNLASYLFMLAPTPFSIGWSESTRYYHASLLLSEHYYGLSLPPFYQDLSRYVMEVIPLLLPNPSLILQRIWEYLLRFLLPALTAALLLRRLAVAKQNRILWFALFLWGTLFLLQGPVYFYLLPAAIPVIAFYHPNKPIQSILALLVASFWAGISRINWLPIPAMLMITLYLLEVPANKSLVRYLFPPALYTVIGFVTAYAARLWYMDISRIDPAMFNASFIQDLLWYRLFPSSLNAWGTLPSGLLMVTPVFLFLLAHLRDHKRWHWIRLLGLGAMLIVLLAGGLIVSAKIGGGNNLHNLDGFAVLYLTVGLYLLFNRFTPDGTADSSSPTLVSPLTLSLAVLAVTVFTSNAITPALPSLNRHQESLTELQQLVDQTIADGGSVLFISQRHLLTYDLISGVPLIPEYDNIDLMEYAITNYRPMIDKFRADMAAHKYALIIAPIPPGQLRETDSAFSEENNAWLKRISIPMLRDYKILAMFEDGGFVVLVPDE